MTLVFKGEIACFHPTAQREFYVNNKPYARIASAASARARTASSEYAVLVSCAWACAEVVTPSLPLQGGTLLAVAGAGGGEEPEVLQPLDRSALASTVEEADGVLQLTSALPRSRSTS